MRDERTVLQENEMIEGNGVTYQIKECIGYGGNCIVYEAKYKDYSGQIHTVRMKECYPYDLALIRREDKSLEVSGKHSDSFDLAKKRFRSAYEANIKLRETLGLTNSTVDAVDLIETNNTFYTVMSVNEGCDFARHEDETLKGLLTHIMSVAKLLSIYHKNGYLHLDVKPENIFILPETEEHILLLDYDTVIKKEELKRADKLTLSFSKGFSAPEQQRDKIKNIGEWTDIYALGATLFYKLFGTVPDFEHCRMNSIYDYSQMKYDISAYQPRLKRMLTDFFRHTVMISPSLRWHNMTSVIEALEKLCRAADLDDVYLLNSISLQSANFIGRSGELKQIHHLLSENNVVFITGIGGIGKTELAKRYAKKHEDLYHTVAFSVFSEDVVSMVRTEIGINNLEQDEDEPDEAFYERKLKKLKAIATSEDLIIIDNFDNFPDDHLERLLDDLERLFECKCKFIVTTRIPSEILRDYGYESFPLNCLSSDECFDVFSVYNQKNYSPAERNSVKSLIQFVEYHTMTVALISKHLRVSGVSPTELYRKFQEAEGITNTGNENVKHRKDRHSLEESVNVHLASLFNIIGLDDTQKELLGSLSLLSGIRMKKSLFLELCHPEQAKEKLDSLIKQGWVEYREKTDKISLHQVIQDVIYMSVSPTADNMPHITKGMLDYMTSDIHGDEYEKSLRRKVFGILMKRLTGHTLDYARLCLKDCHKQSLQDAVGICKDIQTPEAYDVLQEVYRAQMLHFWEFADTFFWDDFDSIQQIPALHKLFDSAVACCEKVSDKPDYLAGRFIGISHDADAAIQAQCQDFDLLEYNEPELDSLYNDIIGIFDRASEMLPETSYSIQEKIALYSVLMEFYSDSNYSAGYRCDHFSDLEKSYGYQEIVEELEDHLENGACGPMGYVEIDGKRRYLQDVSCEDIADRCMLEGKHEQAQKYYMKALDEGEILPDRAAVKISESFSQIGKSLEAIELLGEFIKHVMQDEKDPSQRLRSLDDAAEKLMGFLNDQNNIDKVRECAEKMLKAAEDSIAKEEDRYALEKCFEYSYLLYRLDDSPSKKDIYWDKCMCYLNQLEKDGSPVIQDSFFEDFMNREESSFDTVLFIWKNWLNQSMLEKSLPILDMIVNKYGGSDSFKPCHLKLMIEALEQFTIRVRISFNPEERQEMIKQAWKLLKEAELLYNSHCPDDLYLKNLLLYKKIEMMDADENTDRADLTKARSQCDFRLITENDAAKFSHDLQAQISLWNSAADNYRYAERPDMTAYCLKKSLGLTESDPQLLDEEFVSSYSRLFFEMIDAYIEAQDFSAASTELTEFLTRFTCYMTDINTEANPRPNDQMHSTFGSRESQKRMQIFILMSDHWEKLNDVKNAICTRLAALYVLLEEKPDGAFLFSINESESFVPVICDRIRMLLDTHELSEVRGDVIDCKDKLLQYTENDNGFDKSLIPLMTYITDSLQHATIEFKKE
jgi:NB-ARC domain./Protein kinase domain.